MNDKAKILVVENEAAAAMMMVYLLSRAGFCVVTAWKSEQVFSRAQAGEFDLIILDMHMPGMNGFAVCEQLRADPQLRHTPVIFVSGSFSDECRQRAAELGAADCIARPFNAEDFLARVKLHVSPVQTSGTTTATGEAA